jgi:hypothetical protein
VFSPSPDAFTNKRGQNRAQKLVPDIEARKPQPISEARHPRRSVGSRKDPLLLATTPRIVSTPMNTDWPHLASKKKSLTLSSGPRERRFASSKKNFCPLVISPAKSTFIHGSKNNRP